VFGRRRPIRRRAADAGALRVARLAGAARVLLLALWLAAWPLLGAILARYTDTDVPYFNGFPTPAVSSPRC